MAINKFVDRQGNTLLDLSVDSVSPSKVLAGTTFHGPDGAQHTGTLDPGPMDYSQYNFIDYDGTLLYSYTDEELDALEELPAGPDHTDDNLTFQEWNWSLADLKAWDRTRPDRPIVGANLITTDGKTYLYLDTPYTGAKLSFGKNGTLNSVDWGDGTIDTNTSHVYANPGQYVIVIDLAEGGCFIFGSSSPSVSTNKQWITKIKLGNITPGGNDQYILSDLYDLETITIPRNLNTFPNNFFKSCRKLKNIIIPNGTTEISWYMVDDCFSLQNLIIPNSVTKLGYYATDGAYLKNIIIPNSVTSIEAYALGHNVILDNITIPNGVTKIASNAFSGDTILKNIIIPDSVTSIGSGAFEKCYNLTLDLSQQTKVITLSASIALSTSSNKILVPSSLLADYKSAPYWSDYASVMVGV